MSAPDPTAPRPRAYGPGAIAIAVLATACVIALGVFAGRWQYGRYEDKAEALMAYEAAANMPAIALAELEDVESAQWRIVTATGSFDAASVTALRGRSVQGAPALHHLAWFVTPQGPILVDVGWTPRNGDADSTLPTDELAIEGVLRLQEADDGRRGDGATRIVAAQVPAPPAGSGSPLPGYLMLREPCTVGGCVGTDIQPAPLPQLSLGPHLSYAYQWWLLALLAPFAAIYLVRRDARLEREAQGGPTEAAPPRARRVPRKQPSDEEIEDAL